MRLIYSAGIRIYYLGILMASIFNPKARLWIQGRKNIFRKLSETIKNESTIWIHAASLGEFEQGRPVIEEIRKQYDQYKILLTFFSPSGYEIRKNYNGADYICYLPLDTRQNAAQFIRLIRPQMAIFVKYEFWYHYLYQLNNSHIPVYLISGIFRSGHIFFKWYGKWFRKMLMFFTHLFVQTKESLKLLQGIGINNVTLAGDTRFDRVLQIAGQAKEIAVAASFKGNHPCVIAGSTWLKDEELLIRYINEHNGQTKFIIAPHEVHEEHIQKILPQLKKSFVCFTRIEDADISSKQVLIIDNIGMLSSLYRYGDIAYIGGGFGKGIHNILEAAAFGLPVIFGPNYQKFNEAVELIRKGGALSFTIYQELKASLDKWLNSSFHRIQAGMISKNFVHANAGATKSIIDKICKSP
jgi:3-deoxy-D-manno-octulosonic-acid transferase